MGPTFVQVSPEEGVGERSAHLCNQIVSGSIADGGSVAPADGSSRRHRQSSPHAGSCTLLLDAGSAA